MLRDAGRRRLAALTGGVGVLAAAVAALVGFTRPAPVHATPTGTTTNQTGTSDGAGSGQDGQSGPYGQGGQTGRDGQRSDGGGFGGVGPGGGPPQGGSSGS